MTESQIQSRIIARHKKAGWFVSKIIQTSTNGFPDLILIKHGRVVFIEVKSDKGKLSPLQIYIHDLLRTQQIEVITTNDPNLCLF